MKNRITKNGRSDDDPNDDTHSEVISSITQLRAEVDEQISINKLRQSTISDLQKRAITQATRMSELQTSNHSLEMKLSKTRWFMKSAILSAIAVTGVFYYLKSDESDQGSQTIKDIKSLLSSETVGSDFHRELKNQLVANLRFRSPGEAISVLDECLEEYPHDIDFYVDRAEIFQRIAEEENATPYAKSQALRSSLNDFTTSIKLGENQTRPIPPLPRTLQNRAKVYESLGYIEEALGDLRNALDAHREQSRRYNDSYDPYADFFLRDTIDKINELQSRLQEQTTDK